LYCISTIVIRPKERMTTSIFCHTVFNDNYDFTVAFNARMGFFTKGFLNKTQSF
jgi:hypothetical protein